MWHKEQEYQFYNNDFEFDIFNNSSWINLKFDEIINFIPTKLDYDNYWYKENFIPSKREHGDASYFWLDKREWICWGEMVKFYE